MHSLLAQPAIWRGRDGGLQKELGAKFWGLCGAASGDRTHDILSHSQAFCR